jgi:bifunctional non-homologous end joining protein LigD
LGLQAYRHKRQFDVTTEPRGRRERTKGNLFVVQKHDATRLHYDFRLELDGVLKSWAVAKGPSLVPGEKRLAIHVEDHPVEYGSFEGTIPEGQYGGGTVMLWDRGTWTPDGDAHEGYRKGHLDFTLDGEKLKGRWHLVRMRPRPKERQEGWLLIKGDDAEARDAKGPDILDEQTLSVATRRSLDEIAAGRKPKIRSKVKASAVWQSVARSERRAKPRQDIKPRQDMGARAVRRDAKARPPDFVESCLAQLQAKPPEDAGWVHEIKLDGYRIQARLDNGGVTLKTRKGLDWTAKFSPVAPVVAGLDAEGALIDGEIVAVNAQGQSDFSELQADLKAGRTDRLVYYVFDLLYLDGVDLRRRPLVERKAALERLLEGVPPDGVVRYSAHLEEPGSTVFRQACRMTLEGIISKRRDAPYRSGRTGDWIKTKCADRQEFVIGGYSPSTAAPRAVGALAMGYYDGGKLRYAGRVGTGYTRAISTDLYRRLERLRADKPAFDAIPAEERRRRDMRWVKPQLVAEVDFRGWTGTHVLRHAAFKGLREDKNAREVVREEPAMSPIRTETRPRTGAARTAARHARGARRSPTSAASPGRKAPVDVAGVALTHPDRVYWEDAGVTKRDLAEFYAEIWDWIAPHLVRRPLALLRGPDGAGENCFVQKHAHATFDRSRILSIDDGGEEVIAIEDPAGLVALVQAGVLEVHVWGTTIDHIDTCDRLVFDLDPGPGVDWHGIIAAAREVRERLADLGLESFVKTSGGKGLHVVVPIDAAPWEPAKDFAHRITLEMSADAPEKYVPKMTKSLRHGRIFVDYLRNGRGATAVAAYSSRARAGAPVSTPIAWSELKPALTADKFTVLNLRQRLAKLRSDPWAEIAKVKQKLPGKTR